MSTLDQSGIERIEKIEDRLRAASGFWEAVHSSFDKIGFSDAYVKSFRRNPSQHTSKNFKDSIWGMMEFSPDEVALINSPIVQRLRSIKQNGFTYLTYPSAEHSRFAHTLGVAHVVKRFLLSVEDVASRLNSIEAGAEKYPLFRISTEPDRGLRSQLIHAALLHDCGHTAFSHASEAAFKAHAEEVDVGGIGVSSFLSIFARNGFNSDLSECLSIVICLSPRFQEFYGKASFDEDSPTAIKRICCFIGGVPHSPSYPGLINLISGKAVDADKIDYINRDARECGIPVGVDVARVFLHSALIQIDASQAKALSERMSSDESSDEKADSDDRSNYLLPAGVHFVINSTGIDTYDEVMIAKSVLYNRVYLHHLTRNAEQVFSECIRRYANFHRNSLGKRLDVLSWLEYGDFCALELLRKNSAASHLATRLLQRQLPTRAFALFRSACTSFVRLQDIFHSEQQRYDGVPGSSLNDKDNDFFRLTAGALWADLVPLDPRKRPAVIRKLVEALQLQALEARLLLDPSFAERPCEVSDVYIAFSPRHSMKASVEVLVREKYTIGRSIAWTKSEEVTDAYRLSKDIDYIYSDKEWSAYVAMAALKVLYSFNGSRKSSTISDVPVQPDDFEKAEIKIIPRLGLRIDDVSSRAGFRPDFLQPKLRAAAEKGYFGAATRVVPLEEHQVRACATISELYRAFDGERGWKVSQRSTEAFVRQFSVSIRDEIISILKKGKMLARNATTSGVIHLVNQLATRGVTKLIFSRFSPNSGNLTGMLLEQDTRDDFKSCGHRFCRSLREVEQELEKEDGVVMFLDDQFGSGAQAEAQLRHWLDQDRKHWPESIRKEQNIDLNLPGPKLLSKLKNGGAILSFVYGTAAGERRIKSAANELSLSIDVLYADVLPSHTAAMSGELRKFLEEVGISCLRHCRGVGHDEAAGALKEDLMKDALGYGGQASIVLTPFNAPSHTLTALWAPGIHEGEAWVPLFLRRGYRKHLVLS